MHQLRESNQSTRISTVSLLQVLLIAMVVDEHSGAAIGIMPKPFPYNSFFMPLFVMISGSYTENVLSLFMYVRELSAYTSLTLRGVSSFISLRWL